MNSVTPPTSLCKILYNQVAEPKSKALFRITKLMKKKSFTLDIPEKLLNQLEAIAKASKKSIEEVVLQTLRNGMPPTLREVPGKFHKDLLSLNALGDLELWDIIAAPKKRKKKQDDPIEAEHIGSMRRAYAFSLLKWRGHPVPAPADMMF